MDLWNLSNERIAKLKGETIMVILKDKNKRSIKIENYSVAGNAPHLFCEFITTDGHCIPLEDIDYIELL